MSIFYLINGIAGRFAALDAVMRILYITVVPLLGTLLAAWICCAPRSWMPPKAPRRSRLFLASLLATTFVIISICLINAFEHFALGGMVFSRRPFLTHFVTSLVMEPNNNSFPCFETMFAAAFATLLWAARPRLGMGGWLLALILAITRLYCGTNYTIDVGIGLIWGFLLAVAALAFCGISLAFPLPHQKHLRWRPRHQGVVAVLLMLAVVFYVAGPMAQTPRHFPALYTWLHGAKSTFVRDPSSNDAAHKTREMLLLTKSVQQDGYLPAAEDYLQRVLTKQRTGMEILGVNVAEVKAGKIAYRCAAIRFAVPGQGNAERKRVTAVAVRLLKAAFHADGQLNHIDILGVKMQMDNSIYNTGGTPVFTASVDRQSLIQRGDHAWLNAPQTDPGLWLRARSLLYFDPQILPSDEVFPVKEFLKKDGGS